MKAPEYWFRGCSTHRREQAQAGTARGAQEEAGLFGGAVPGRLREPWALGTPALARIDGDASWGLVGVAAQLGEALGVPPASIPWAARCRVRARPPPGGVGLVCAGPLRAPGAGGEEPPQGRWACHWPASQGPCAAEAKFFPERHGRWPCRQLVPPDSGEQRQLPGELRGRPTRHAQRGRAAACWRRRRAGRQADAAAP